MKKYLLLWMLFFLFGCFREDETSSVPMASQNYKILALGDSLTAGYGVESTQNYPSQLEAILQKNNYPYRLINAWVSGDTSANVLSRAQLYLEQKPDMVILVVGWNDGLRGLDISEMKENIKKIIEIFQSQNIPVVLWGMDIPQNLWEQYRNDFKKVYDEIAKENSKIFLIPFFLEWVAGKKDLNIEDMIHPNSKGYAIIVENVFTFLEKNNLLLK